MYDLGLDEVISKVRDANAKLVCVQLPDGLKPKADIISDKIEEETGARVIIWAGTCFGACDIPLQVRDLGVDLLVQWGHSEWR